MGYGMIGALGGFGGGTGIGGAMMNEASIMLKEEERKQAMADQKGLEAWRMSTAEGYKIAAEARAEQTAIRADTRAWENEKTRAPERADMAASASVKAKNADLEFNTKNRDAIAANAKAMKEAQETDAEKEERRARADYYSGRTEAALNPRGTGGKLDPMLAEQIKSMDNEIERKAGHIDSARAKGEWSGTPEQKALQAELVALKLRRENLYRQGSPSTPERSNAEDPIGIRGAAARTSTPAPAGARGGKTPLSTPEDRDMEAIYRGEYERAKKTAATATDPDVKRRAESDMEAVVRDARRMGVDVLQAAPTGMVAAAPRAAQPAPAAPAAPPAAPGPSKSAFPIDLGSIPGAQNGVRVTKGTDLGEGTLEDKIARLRAGTRGGAAAPAPAAAAEPVRAAMGASGNSEIDRIVGERAPAFMEAAQAVKDAQAKVVQASKSQQADAVQKAMAEAEAAGRKLDAMLQNMMPEQQRRMRQALGL